MHTRSKQSGIVAPILLIGALVLVLVGIAVYLVFFSNKKNQEADVGTNQPVSTASPLPVSKAPSFQFDTYKLRVAIPSTPTSLTSYQLKSNFSADEAKQFASKFGLKSTANSNDMLPTFSDTSNPATIGLLVFNRKTGTFSYQSFGTQKPKGYVLGQPAALTVTTYLEELGLADGTVSCPITYQRHGSPSVTFVECHRDWTKLGAPLVTLPGVLNLAETQRLNQFKVGMVDATAPADATVISVSTGDNGKARPNDFNTVTVGIYPDGRIQSVVSSMRWVTKMQPVQSNAIVSAQDAIKQIQSNKALFSLAMPAGTGTVDWDKAFPNGLAQAKEATVSDIAVIYLERPASETQTAYDPYYLVRGTAKLASGYTVRFNQVVPATKPNGLTGMVKQVVGTVAGVSTLVAADTKQLKLDTFATPSPAPVIPLPTTNACPITPAASTGGTTIAVDVPGYGTVNIGILNTADFHAGGSPHVFYVASSGSGNVDMEKAREALYAKIEEQYVINVARYIQDSPQNVTSVSQAVTLFGLINNLPGDVLACYTREHNVFRPAPLTCGGDQSDTIYEPATMQAVQQHVAEKIVQASQQNKIAELAAKPDIFPATTIVNMHWSFAQYGSYYSPQTGGCSYLSGLSPTIFVYPRQTTNVTIKPMTNLTYVDPNLVKGAWQIIAQPNGTLATTNGAARSSLYYEYDRNTVTLNPPTQGFVVSRDSYQHSYALNWPLSSASMHKKLLAFLQK